MNRSNMGKQIQTAPKRGPMARGMKMPAPSMEAEMPDFRARALRPGGMKKGGAVKMAAGGKVRGDGMCSRGHTKGKYI